MASPPILKIALPTPLRRCFDYLPPSTNQSGPYLPGSRIRVPFGNRDMVGILVQVVDHSDVPRNKLKPANKIIDEQPIIPAHILRLYEWCANYYQHPLGDVLATALPTLLRKGETNLRQTEIVYLATELGRAQAQDQLSRAPKQAEVMALALEHPKGFGEHAIQTLGLSGSPLKALLDKGFLVRQSIQITPQRRSATILAEAPLTLNTHQRQAVDAVTQSLAAFSCFLIEGVTGSGKTEVYLQVIGQVLKKGGSALVLVPEIGLTPQTVSRFKRRFNVPITLLSNVLMIGFILLRRKLASSSALAPRYSHQSDIWALSLSMKNTTFPLNNRMGCVTQREISRLCVRTRKIFLSFLARRRPRWKVFITCKAIDTIFCNYPNEPEMLPYPALS